MKYIEEIPKPGQIYLHRRLVLSLVLVTSAACAQGQETQRQESPRGGTANMIVLPTITVSSQLPGQENGPVHGYVAEEVTVGSKIRTPVMKVPASVSIVTREQMEIQSSNSTSQALRYTAGANGERFGGFGSQLDITRIRGIDADYYLDGLRVVGNPGSWLPQIDPWTLERVEVLRGPSSAVYGQGTGGGIINQVSKRPMDEMERELFVQYGSFNRKQIGFDITGSLDEDNKLLYRFTVSGLDSREQVEAMQHRRLYVAPSLTWRITPDTSWTILTTYSREPSIPDYNSLPVVVLGLDHSSYPQVDRQRNFTDTDFSDSSRSQNSVTSLFEHNFGDGWSFVSNARHMYVSSDLQRGVVYGYQVVYDQPWLKGYDEITPSKVNSFSMDNHISGKLSTGILEHTLLGGVDYTFGRLDSALYSVGPVLFNPYGEDYRPHIRRDFSASQAAPWKSHQEFSRVGAYLQDQLAYDNWLLTLSARHDWSDTEDETQSYSPVVRSTKQKNRKWSGRAGLGYQFTQDFMAYVSYATSFDPLIGTDYKGNPFIPVEANQMEVGVKFHPTGSGSLISAAVFNLEQTNVKTTDTQHLGFNNQTGKIRNRGFDIAATVELMPNLNLVANYTWLDSRVVSDPLYQNKSPAQAPRHSASTWLDYRFTGLLAGLRFGGGMRYLGSTWGDPGNTFKVPSVTLFDLTASYDLHYLTGHDVTLSVNASNLTDRKYLASCTSEMYCFIGQDRVVTATLRYWW
ncbi:TonB-dependent siderophore receptor [Xenorhabdus thuongxuanensis]|uniref:Ferrichrysobactin receptor n=1 Tax=Xenorhabdus thuongxuanensis TaxID=1873484 RepID=A0A1Q5TWW0_9GAMM|nr:TonB-dependent siderophore receptor [Xenorhabdus thuongxuanensis]OKP04683.1 ferrichrysobactin receptor [Xenorhabdus thuongxuanensis]